ncbi:MAG: hydroxyisourate hydrolase [Sphingomonadales bacterium]
MDKQQKQAGRLTTHVLDTMSGRPAAGVGIDLFRITGDCRQLIGSVKTNSDGRCDHPLLEGADFHAGIYELVFHIGDYFANGGDASKDPAFLGDVPIRVGLAHADQHYHVPLLASPYAYSTYRGS